MLLGLDNSMLVFCRLLEIELLIRSIEMIGNMKIITILTPSLVKLFFLQATINLQIGGAMCHDGLQNQRFCGRVVLGELGDLRDEG